MRRRIDSRAGAGAALLVLAALALSGCVEGDPMPTPTATETGLPGEPSATPEPEPVLDLQGTAADNLAYFNKVNRALVVSGAELDGRAFIDNLVEAGFAKSSMEVTPDRTSINAQADQVQFSVRINGTCLVGQYDIQNRYTGVAAPLLSTGTCLVGTTRPIDW
jgi:hypothetical protein